MNKHIGSTLDSLFDELGEPLPVASAPAVDAPRPKARRGFAAMAPATQQAIASLGGKAAHAKGVAHEFTTEEARIAGRKGGRAARARRAGAS